MPHKYQFGSFTARDFASRRSAGFTLVELLTVIAIIVILASLTVPALKQSTSGNFNDTVSGLSETLSQARSYAMAHNTYVFVGLTETNATQSSTATPLTTGTGRLCVSVVAAQDGTANYDPNNLSSGWTSTSNLSSILKLQFFNNVHLVQSLGNTGNMTRPTVSTNYQLNGAATSYFQFTYPLTGTTRCTFNNVLQFDAQGECLSLSGTAPGNLTPWIEIGLKPTNGTTITPGTNQAAIQIGQTGAIRIFRP